MSNLVKGACAEVHTGFVFKRYRAVLRATQAQKNVLL